MSQQHTVPQLGQSTVGFSQWGPAFSARAVRVGLWKTRHVDGTLGLPRQLPFDHQSTSYSIIHHPEDDSGPLQAENTQRHSLAPDENK